jgi:methenyltetrahydrofolate cyclohydrolase
MESFLEQLAAASPSPGGGSAAAYAGSVGIALLEKVVRIEHRRAGNNAGAEFPWESRLARVVELSAELVRLREDDVRSYAKLSAALSVDRASEAFLIAVSDAVNVPVRIVEAARKGCALIMEVAPECRRYLVPDLQVAAELMNAMSQGAFRIGIANLGLLCNQDNQMQFMNYALLALHRAKDQYALTRAVLVGTAPFANHGSDPVTGG